LLAHLGEQPAGRFRQWDAMRGLLLGRTARLGPDAGFDVDVAPAGGEKLAAAAAGQQQQPDRIGGALVA
jgi:hypothetical protein